MPDRDEDVLGKIRRGQLYTESEASFRDPLRRADLIFEYHRTPPGDGRLPCGSGRLTTCPIDS